LNIDPQKKYAILTGDVVHSSRLEHDHRKQLYALLQSCSRRLRQAFPDHVPLDVDIFRGDSWQLLVVDPVHALRVALYFRAALRAAMQTHQFDSRLAIGIGAVDFIPEQRLSGGDGEAFRLSGEGLETLKRHRMTLIWPGHPDQQLLQAMVWLFDQLAIGWTDKQALAITGALQNWTQQDIAQLWNDHPISQQTVAQHLAQAGWGAMAPALRRFESAIRMFIG
jgi:hypothetical protein